MQQQSTFRKYMGLISLGYMGGTIYVLMYIRYVFYDQMIQVMQISNTQLGMLNTVCSIISFIVSIPGAYFADKLDAACITTIQSGTMTGDLACLCGKTGVTSVAFLDAVRATLESSLL